jgi:serine/threonine protein kinase/dipeptidyl aminopeptidase/acylaminoacyl peptidase
LLGETLSHFRITAKLGEGGMGAVYLAEDTKLGREVAIKVLPEALTADPERLARLEREAKVLASLNHQNVAGIFEVGAAAAGEAGLAEGASYLVMEYVPGDDLAEVLGRGAIPLDEALPIAIQVAEALEAAHERGIVHRDLKPANVKLTPEGRVKVLDFGLARAWDESDGATSSLSMSPTLTAQMTQAGVILGTAAYMSPEQARGKRVDKRSDIWAFGVLLYEMLTGARGFEGDTVTDLIAAIVTRDPDWERLPPETPRSLHDLLERCLQKDPLQRLRDIGDARIELGAIATQPHSPADVPTPETAAGAKRLPWIVAALAALLALASLLWRPPAPAPSTGRTQHLSIVLPESQRPIQYDPLAIASGGTEVVYAAHEDGVLRLYRRPLDEPRPVPVPGTEGGRRPFVSPDGLSIGFETPEALRVVPVGGGLTRDVCACQMIYGATWSASGRIVFSPRWSSGLWSVPATVSGATPTELTTIDRTRGDVAHVFPQALPDGKHVLFTIWAPSGPSGAVASLDDGEVRIVHEGGMHYRYVASGHLLFGERGSLQALPFEIDALETHGQPRQLADGLYRYSADGFTAFEVSPEGLLAYRTGGQGRRRRLLWVDRQGTTHSALEAVDYFGGPTLSPDGKRIAVELPNPNGALQIVVLDLEGGVRTQLTTDGDNTSPLFSPDGSHVFFARAESAGYWLASSPVDGSEPPTALSEPHDSFVSPSSISPDGRFLTYTVRHPIDGDSLHLIELAGDATSRKLAETAAGQILGGLISPDGRWLAYTSDATGREEVYLTPFDRPGGSSQITRDGGVAPTWNPTGSGELFYVSDGTLMSLTLDTTSSPRVTAPPRRLFDFLNERPTSEEPDYSVAPDGEAFLIVDQLPPGAEANQIHLILGLFDELASP